ncbi:ParB-like protein [Novosphingobium pokkalii]|uniref:ParB-like protein n=1 Tax=Novosphingobium pokkalii TaxID=1770194 RepID=UPI0036277149
MGLSGPIQPILKTVAIADLRPTQMTVGLREVERKRRDWLRRQETSAAGEFLGAHMIPAVIGPDDQLWMLDHHHLALALHLEGGASAGLDHRPAGASAAQALPGVPRCQQLAASL